MKSVKIIKFFLLVIFFISTAQANNLAGKIEKIIGEALVKRGNEVITVESDDFVIYKNDVIKTLPKSKLKIRLTDDTIVYIGAKTTLEISKYFFDAKNANNNETDLKILNGSFKIKTGKIGDIVPNRFKIKTKLSVIGIRG